MTTIGIVAFDDVEELDFAGPWEVFGMARKLRDQGDRLLLLAEREAPIRCAKLMRVLPDLTFAQAPKLDVLLVPGGVGTRREVKNEAMTDFLRRAGAQASWVTSVCTGSLLLHEAGFARGKRVTTHWTFIEQLRIAGTAGAAGFLAGRGIWGPALVTDPDEVERRATTISLPAFLRCAEIAERACRPLSPAPR